MSQQNEISAFRQVTPDEHSIKVRNQLFDDVNKCSNSRVEPDCLPPFGQQQAAAAARRPSTGGSSPLSSSACPGRAAETARRVLPTVSHSVPVNGEPRGRVHIQPEAATNDITLDGLVRPDILFLSRTRCC